MTVQPLSVLQRLVAYVDHLAVLGLLLEENNSLLMYSAINFIELVGVPFLVNTWGRGFCAMCLRVRESEHV